MTRITYTYRKVLFWKAFHRPLSRTYASLNESVLFSSFPPLRIPFSLHCFQQKKALLRARISWRSYCTICLVQYYRTFFCLSILIYCFMPSFISPSSILSSRLYFATRSERQGAPALIWPALNATAISAIVVSSVSPDLCEIIVLYPAS